MAYNPFHPARRPFAGFNMVPPYPTDPANRPYTRFYYPPYFPYNHNAPLRINPYARLPPRPQFPRGNPPPPVITPFLQQQIDLSAPALFPPISSLFDDLRGPYIHHRLRNIGVFLDTFFAALPKVIAGPIILPLEIICSLPGKALSAAEEMAENFDGENLRRVIQDFVWVFERIDQFLDQVVLRTLVLLVLRPLSQVRGFVKERLLMREVWCFVAAVVFVKVFLDRPILVVRDEERRWGLWYMLIPEFKVWASDVAETMGERGHE